MNLTKGYNERLQRTFPWLRMRWSDYKQMWLLEAKTAYGRMDVNPTTCNPDTLIQRREGYTPIGEYTPGGLPPLERFIPLLEKNWTGGRAFTRQYGGGSAESQEAALNREIIEREAQKALTRRKDQRLQNYETANRLWDIEHKTIRSQVPISYEGN